MSTAGTESPVLVDSEYEDWPELPACSLCLALNTSDYCHHTGQYRAQS